MLRKVASVVLFVSIIAMGTSGLLMIVLDSLAFQIQIHGLHKVFGVIMCAAACVHIYYNIRVIKNHLKKKLILAIFSLLLILMIILAGFGLSRPIDKEKAHVLGEQIEALEHE